MQHPGIPLSWGFVIYHSLFIVNFAWFLFVSLAWSWTGQMFPPRAPWDVPESVGASGLTVRRKTITNGSCHFALTLSFIWRCYVQAERHGIGFCSHHSTGFKRNMRRDGKQTDADKSSRFYVASSMSRCTWKRSPFGSKNRLFCVLQMADGFTEPRVLYLWSLLGGGWNKNEVKTGQSVYVWISNTMLITKL